ncbi:hypothetical protein AB0H73_09285 [Streptomyces olivoreticuli]
MTDPAAGFEVVTGDEGPIGPGQSPGQRAAVVRQAMEGLLQIRRITNPPAGRPVSVPAEWERLQPLRAISLALEAAKVPASAVGADGRRIATGYRVYRESGTVRVAWAGPPGSGAIYQQPEGLRLCTGALEDLGWQTLEYRGARRHRWLEAEAPPSP